LLGISVKIDAYELTSRWMWNMSNNMHVSDEVSKLYESLLIKRDKLKEQLADVEKQFDAVATTLKLMGLPTPGMSNLNLAGKTHLKALIEIAKLNDNILVIKTARRLMTRANMFGNPKNASSILFTAVSRSGKFKALSKGKYELLEIKEPKMVMIPPAVPVEVSDKDHPLLSPSQKTH
jgi:hypothetical protein